MKNDFFVGEMAEEFARGIVAEPRDTTRSGGRVMERIARREEARSATKRLAQILIFEFF
jgi:hypothetical protein